MNNVLGKAIRMSSFYKNPMYNVVVFYNNRRFYIRKDGTVREMTPLNLGINLKKIHENDVPEPWQLTYASIRNGVFIV